MKHDAIIIGAGLAGLACARQLQSQGIPCLLVEAADQVGGRIRADAVDGFQLDRGFQVLLDSYPELKRVLDLDALQLRAFASGALVRYQGRFHRLVDPWRNPLAGVQSLFNPIGTWADKLRVARLRSQSLKGTYTERMRDTETTTLEYLQRLGFTSRMINSFLRPFLGGIFLDSELNTSSRMLNFVFRMFSIGHACLPSQGMQALPLQLASQLKSDQLRLNSPVVKVGQGMVQLASGEEIHADKVVVAVDGPAAARLLPDLPARPGRGVRCLYYAAPEPPLSEPILVLNGDQRGPINNLCVPSNVCPSYAPPGQSLISVTVLGAGPKDAIADDIESQVRAQLQEWYGQAIHSWRLLRCYNIPYALPDQACPALAEPQRPIQYAPGIYVCGDHRDNASIEGALVSGRRAAEAVCGSQN